MDGNQDSRKRRPYISQEHGEPLPDEDNENVNLISIEQLQQLVRLLDSSDISELELRRAQEGTRLVLRKAKAPESNEYSGDVPPTVQFIDPSRGARFVPPQFTSPVPAARPIERKHHISAHFVGIFHASARPRGGALVKVGEHVKVGQLVATIESLNVINEVESPVAGRVVEIHVQEGQPVEYGQHLMIIASPVEEEET